MKMRAIAAVDGWTGGIGLNNELLFHNPVDMTLFRLATEGTCVVYGRKTFEGFQKPAGLPLRRNIMLSRTATSIPGVETYRSIEEVLNAIKDEPLVYIIGGESIYKQFLPYCDEVYWVSFVSNGEFVTADKFFPELDPSEWKPRTPISINSDLLLEIFKRA